MLNSATEILTRCNIHELSISIADIRNLLSDIQNKYKQNPFHSFSHALTVAQMMYLFINQTKLGTMLTTKEKFTLLLCMMCHDLEHPGLSNGFQINSRSHLAKRYNNTSVLENHHLACSLQLLYDYDERVQLLKGFSDEERKYFYSIVTTLILSTDLANHFVLIKDYEKIAGSFVWDNKLHRESLFIMLVKAADISNEARPFPISQQWADALMREYFAQSELEKAESLPVTPFMDKEKVVLPKTQLNFIETFLIPTFTLLQQILPEMHIFIDIINSNKQNWANQSA